MRRLLVHVALLAALALAAPSHAASFSYSDPADMPADGGLDILSVGYSTAGKGKGKSYVPSTLIATMTLAAPPFEQPVVGFSVAAVVADCGELTFTYTPGTVGSAVLGPALVFVGCGGTTDPTSDNQLLTPKFEGTGSTLTWSIGLKALPKEIRAGAELTSLRALVDVVEPVTGSRITEVSSEAPTPGLIDTATTTATWRIG